MEIKQINLKQKKYSQTTRPQNFENFIWQQNIKNILQKAIISAKSRNDALWHILLWWASWYWKTTLASIIANQMWVKMHTITAYAISKPADLISILNILENWDIVFIDEIHRLHPKIEEILYIAMEDFAIDMVMPDWWNMRIPLNKFTLIWATTKLESLSQPLKNRFIYSFHFVDYNLDEKKQILQKYLDLYINKYDSKLINKIVHKVDSVPREIHNLVIKIRDFLIANQQTELTDSIWAKCEERLDIDDWWITPLHKKYLSIFDDLSTPVWIKTISAKLWISEKSIENDIEPLLLKLWLIKKTSRWRIKTSNI